MPTKRKHPETPTAIRFDAGTMRWLREFSGAHDLTVSQVVRRAVSDYQERAGVCGGPPPIRKVGGA